MDDFVGRELRIVRKPRPQEIALAFGQLLLPQHEWIGQLLLPVQVQEGAQGQVEREAVCWREKPLQHVILDRLLFLCLTALLTWLHQTVLLSRFLRYVEGPVLSPVHSGCWIAAGISCPQPAPAPLVWRRDSRPQGATATKTSCR